MRVVYPPASAPVVGIEKVPLLVSYSYRYAPARLLADWLKQGDSSTHGLNRDGVVRAGTTNEEFYGYSTQDQHRLGACSSDRSKGGHHRQGRHRHRSPVFEAKQMLRLQLGALSVSVRASHRQLKDDFCRCAQLP